ncbi:MAG: hypothetical protein IJ560_02545 [Alphaproteobacteria bacterium]|nr:hypothetical protein [Alphaproteobacteria bacterium]
MLKFTRQFGFFRFVIYVNNMLCFAILLCANAYGELPENVKFCIPKQYTVTYDCGVCGGTAPASTVTSYGMMFTTPGENSGCIVNGPWNVDGTDTVITMGTTLPFTYVHDVKLVAPSPLPMDVFGTIVENAPARMTWGTAFEWGNVSGIAMCSPDTSDKHVVRDSISDDTGDDESNNCWCKMTAPYETKWVFRNYPQTADQCRKNCTHNCGHYLGATGNRFREILFCAIK